MNLILEFHPEAEAEVQCVTGDYEAKVPGLGARFRHEVEDACSAIVQHPLLWRLREEGWRRVNLPGFPYHLAFIIREDVALIVAVSHHARQPGYWKSRWT
jgi:plasmid stabilization system protein ParE